MKQFCFLLFFAMTAVLSAAAAKPATTSTTKPAATTTAKPAETAKPAATTTTKPAATTTAKPTETAKPAATTTNTKPAAATTTAKPAETAKPAAAAAAKPATPKPAATVLSLIYSANRDPAEFADPEKAGDLLNRRIELVQKIQNERKRLLKEDNTAKQLNEEIMLLNRKLASLLETKKSMIELNSELRDLDIAISRLKPAPPPAPETKEPKNEDGAKADKE